MGGKYFEEFTVGQTFVHEVRRTVTDMDNILFSALTTGTAFGSLALSAHPGTASMGDLLLISLACTLLASLVFIPALLACLRSPAQPS